MLERRHEVQVAEHLVPALVGVARVRDLLAVLGAVARIVERRVGLERAGVERGRGGDDLERRARRVEPLRCAIEQGGAVAAGAANLQHLRVAARLVDQVRVVRRRRRHHGDGAGMRIHRDDRAAPVAEQLLRETLGARADRQLEVVARARCALPSRSRMCLNASLRFVFAPVR